MKLPLDLSTLKSSSSLSARPLTRCSCFLQNHFRWGRPPIPLAPPGADLRVLLAPGASSAVQLAAWRNITHALGGILCASLNLLADAHSVAAPAFILSLEPLPRRNPPEGSKGGSEGGSDGTTHNAAGTWLLGSLPQEAVCTENLNAWLRLLPGKRDNGGLPAVLYDLPAVFSAEFQSLRIRFGADGAEPGRRGGGGVRRLTQSLTLVTARGPPRDGGGWRAVRGSGGYGPLPNLAAVAAAVTGHRIDVYLAAAPEGASQASSQTPTQTPSQAPIQTHAEAPIQTQIAPDGVAEDVPPLGRGVPTDVEGARGDSCGRQVWVGSLSMWHFPLRCFAGKGVSWEGLLGEGGLSVEGSGVRPVSPVTIEQYLTGKGMMQGGFVLEVRRAPEEASGTDGAAGGINGAPWRGCLYQSVPWYLQMWMHTLTVHVDGQVSSFPECPVGILGDFRGWTLTKPAKELFLFSLFLDSVMNYSKYWCVAAVWECENF